MEITVLQLSKDSHCMYHCFTAFVYPLNLKIETELFNFFLVNFKTSNFERTMSDVGTL